MHGKFDNALDEAIWSLSLDGGADEEVGSSSESPFTWAGLMRDGAAMASQIAKHPGDFPNVRASEIEFLRSDGLAGAIITENSQGFIKVAYYKSVQARDKDWAEAEAELGGSGDDDEEPSDSERPSQEELDDFGSFCAQATDRQLPNIYEKERSAGRMDTARLAKAEMQKRGVYESNARKGRPQGRHRPNTTIADRRKAGVIEGLTKAEMDSMEIRIPTFDWKQIGGDVNPGAHGGTIATANGTTIEMIEIQPVREHVGDREAKDVGHPFWSKEGYYDLDDLSLSDPGVQSSIETFGLGEHLLDMTPEQRAVAIAEACLGAGHRSDEGPAGWAEDVIGARQVEWWGSNGKKEGYEYIADEDDEFRREVLELYEVLNGMDTVSFHEEENDAIEEAEALAEKHPDADITVQQGGSEVWNSADEDEEGLTENQSGRIERSAPRRPAHRSNASESELERSGVLEGLLDMEAESMDPSGRGRVPREVKAELFFTPELREVVRQYESALREALEEAVQRFPPNDGASAEDLFADNAPYLVLMTLRGEGVGIWDGDWEEHYSDTKPIEGLLKQKLRGFADSSGSGQISEALMSAVSEAMERAGYGFDDHAYVKKGDD